MSDGKALKNKFYNWVMKIQYDFLENDLFQPIGLEISCVDIVLETNEDYSFNGIENSEISSKYYPLAYYRPDTDSIHIFIEHESFLKRPSDREKYAFLMFLLFHEANHRLLMHIKRGEEKDHDLYNISADMEIHNMYYVYNEILNSDQKYFNSNVYKLTKEYVVDFLFNKYDKEKNEGLFEKDFLQNTAEEIYSILQNSKQVSEKEFSLNMSSNSSNNSSNSSCNNNSNNNSNSNSSCNNNNNSNSNENKNGKNGKEGKEVKEDKDGNSGSGDEKDKSGNENKENNKEGSGLRVKVKEITYKLPSGKEITTTSIEMPEVKNDGQSEEDAKNKEQGALTRKTLMENNLQNQMDKLSNDENSRQRGTMHGACKAFLKKLFHIKIDWKKILRNSLQTALEKSEYFSWAQPRTSLFGMPGNVYLPGQIEDECAYGTVIIARDESGSMSNEECEKAAGIIYDSKEHYKKIIVIKHDTEITSVNEIEEMDEEAKKMLLHRNSQGGTSHKEVFEFIKKYAIDNKEDEKISCCIFITDMESDIVETQNIIPDEIPRIWLTTPSSSEHFKNSVKGKIIPIEL